MSKDWYPVIDYEKCDRCIVCYDYCRSFVYDVDSNDCPIVIRPENCIKGCHGCSTRCPVGAISYFGDDSQVLQSIDSID